MKPLVYFHANCTDGFTAAWVARRALMDADFEAVQYGDSPDRDAYIDREVFVLDFSFPAEVIGDMIAYCKKLVVLDHHKTAQEALKPFTLSNAAHVRFDMNRSGAQMAWDYFFPAHETPWLVSYVQDRDLWQWKLDKSREVSAGISKWKMTFENWDRLYRMYVAEVRDEGEVILEYQKRVVESQIKNAVPMMIGNVMVPTMNATLLISEIGEELCKGQAFSATYFIDGQGHQVWSLRSENRPDAYQAMDVSIVAKSYGGGGHKNAAGFRMKPGQHIQAR